MDKVIYDRNIKYLNETCFPGVARNASLLLLLPSFHEYEIIPLVKSILYAFENDDLFMSNYSFLKIITEDLYLIINCKDANVIRGIYYKICSSGIDLDKYFLNIRDIMAEKEKYDYANKFSQYYTPSEKFVDKYGNEYDNVVDITNEDFYLFIHNISVGFSNSENAEMLLYRPCLFTDKNWGNSNTISGSIVTKDFIGHACRVGDGLRSVNYGFNHLTKDDIITIGNCDIQTEWNVSDRLPNYSPTVYFTPDKLSKNMVGQYAEGLIWRSKEGEKRKPDYILCFDEIGKNSLYHSEYYNIPIYYIDTLKWFKNKTNDLRENFELLKSSGNYSFQNIEDYFLQMKSFLQVFKNFVSSTDYKQDDKQEILVAINSLFNDANKYIEESLKNYSNKLSNMEKIKINKLLENNQKLFLEFRCLRTDIYML